MDTERKPQPESISDPETEDSATPPGEATAQAAASAANLERDVRAVTRSSRYALITALCVVILSSGVSAGSAIYVSKSQLERREHAEAAQVVRDNRQTVYTELAATLMAYVEELGGLKGELTQNPPDRAEVRAQVLELLDKGQLIWRTLTTVLLVGNLAFVPALESFTYEYYVPFTKDHLSPFLARGGAAETDEGLRQSGPPLLAEVDRMIAGITDFLTSFLDQAREDLGIG